MFFLAPNPSPEDFGGNAERSTNTQTITNKDNQLNRILKFININEDKKDYTAYFTAVRDHLLQKLQLMSPAFKSLCNGNDLAGSYADGLKVMSPNEFDFHVYLRLREFNLLGVETVSDFPGQVDLNVKRVLDRIRPMQQYSDVHKVLLSLIDENNYLVPKKIQSWLEGLLIRAKNDIGERFQIGSDKYYITHSRSGPAQTFDVVVNGRDTFSIDFVPVIKIMVSEHWPCPSRDPVSLSVNNFWVAVPKPRENTTSFQTSFEFMERKIISNKNTLKAVDRLLKKLRDRHNITNLKSYYIKTVCMWKDDEVDRNFWNKSLYFVFIEVFKKLLSFGDEMPFYWDKEQNMFDKLSEYQRVDIHRKLVKILKDIEQGGPNDLPNIFRKFKKKL